MTKHSISPVDFQAWWDAGVITALREGEVVWSTHPEDPEGGAVVLIPDVAEVVGAANGLPLLPATWVAVTPDGRTVKAFRLLRDQGPGLATDAWTVLTMGEARRASA